MEFEIRNCIDFGFAYGDVWCGIRLTATRLAEVPIAICPFSGSTSVGEECDFFVEQSTAVATLRAAGLHDAADYWEQHAGLGHRRYLMFPDDCCEAIEDAQT